MVFQMHGSKYSHCQKLGQLIAYVQANGIENMRINFINNPMHILVQAK